MKKHYEIIVFDCEGHKILETFISENHAIKFAERHGLEIFSIVPVYTFIKEDDL